MIFCSRRINETSLFVFNVSFCKLLLMIVIRLSISFILCKVFNLVLVCFSTTPCKSAFSNRGATTPKKLKKEMT